MSTKFQTERGFTIHTLESAPEASQVALKWYLENVQMVPNLAGVMAESPVLINSYLATQQNIQTMPALTPQEANIVQTTIAHANECQYCVALHTAFGEAGFGNTKEQLSAIRNEQAFDDPKLNALRDFTLRVLENSGRMATSQLQSFLDAGYSRAAALDVVANIAAKVMSNFANQIAMIPIDEPFLPLANDLPYKEDRKKVTV